MALVDDYRGVIFDYGGVLAFHQSEQDIQRLVAIAGLTQETFEQSYWSHRPEYDRGLVSAEEYWNKVGSGNDRQFDSETIIKLTKADSLSWMRLDSTMLTAVDDLRGRRKRLAMLSNMPRDLGHAIQHDGKLFNRFDHVTLSYEVRSVKPEPEVYEHCLQGLALRPEEAIFLDDRQENIDAARQLGIRAVRFTSAAETMPQILA